MKNLLLHRSVAIVGDETPKSVSQINSIDFNFQGHFDNETIAKYGRWWVCYKTKPWAIRDLMIIDSTKNYARSISDLDQKDIGQLKELIVDVVDELKTDCEVEMIVFGANINPYESLSDSESIARLHIHVCGFSQDEIKEFENTEIEEFDAFNDPIIEEFKTNFDFGLDQFEQYDLGIKSDIGKFDQQSLAELLKKASLKTEESLNAIKSQSRYSLLSYSFAIRIEGDKTELFVSAKSRNGRGVLESFGIVLHRDKMLKASREYLTLRNKFLNIIKNKLLKLPGVIPGKAKLEEI